jgi:hypothetical protein
MVYMADSGIGETFEHTLAGRLMVFKRTQRTQILVLERYSTVLQGQIEAALAADDQDTVIKLINKLNEATWSAVESRFTSEDDLDFARMKIINGELEEKHLMQILSNGYVRQEPDDDADPAPPVKKAAKKAVKKAAAAKKTANPRRASR